MAAPGKAKNVTKFLVCLLAGRRSLQVALQTLERQLTELSLKDQPRGSRKEKGR
jgi:hypothetical protein